MKIKLRLLGLLLFPTFACLSAQTPYYYYYKGEKQYLELDTEYAFISVADEDAANKCVADNRQYRPFCIDTPKGKQSRTNHKRYWSVLSFGKSLSDEAYLAKLSEIKKSGKNMIVAPYFKNRQQDKIGLSNFFYVRLKSLNDTVSLRREAEKEHAIVLYQSELMPLWFVLTATEHSTRNAMETANRFHESGLFLYAEPDFIVEMQTSSVNDPYFMYQWGLQNNGQYGGTQGVDINVSDAWNRSTGSGITVAVFDMGIEADHPDLAANMHPLSYDCVSQTSPQQVYDVHGTACAGIVGAVSNNGIGIAGVAPECQLMAISNLSTSTIQSVEKMAEGISWAWRNGADVINGSWNTNGVYSNRMTEAIDSAVIHGREGKGCVLVFASGNDNSNDVDYPAGLPNVIAVGAIDRNGQRASFSNYGGGLDIVAPGVDIYTTDLQGSGGFDLVEDYYYDTGTSFATPHVAGIAALLLSFRPDLTAAQVREAIERGTFKVGGYNYQNISGRPNGEWHEEMGYGLADADFALSVASPYILGSSNICTESDFEILDDLNTGVQVTWTVTSGFSVSPAFGNSVTVTATETNGQSGTLTATLAGGRSFTRTITACYLSPSISGTATICDTETYTINVGQVVWSVTSGFSLTPASGSSTTVTATALNGQSGMLTATLAGGQIVTKTIQACNMTQSISGSTHICWGNYSLTPGLPAGWSAAWTVTRIKSIYGSNPSTVTEYYYTPNITLDEDSDGRSECINLSVAVKNQYGTTVQTCTFAASGGPFSPDAGTLQWSNIYTYFNTTNSQSYGNTLYLRAGTTNEVAVDRYTCNTNAYFGPFIEYASCSNFDVDYDAYNSDCMLITVPYSAVGYSGYLSVSLDGPCGTADKAFLIPVSVIPDPYSYRPNPVSDNLTVEISRQFSKLMSSLPGAKRINDPTYDIRLYDGRGNLLRQQVTKGGSVQFNVAALPNGIYYLHIRDGVSDKPEIRKIVVEH